MTGPNPELGVKNNKEIHFNRRPGDVGGLQTGTIRTLAPPYGDEWRDYFMIKQGFRYYDDVYLKTHPPQRWF
jgi:hypothetical protein